MNRDKALRALRAHEQEFRAAGVVSVFLFSSVARKRVRSGRCRYRQFT